MGSSDVHTQKEPPRSRPSRTTRCVNTRSRGNAAACVCEVSSNISAMCEQMCTYSSFKRIPSGGFQSDSIVGSDRKFGFLPGNIRKHKLLRPECTSIVFVALGLNYSSDYICVRSPNIQTCRLGCCGSSKTAKTTLQPQHIQ